MSSTEILIIALLVIVAFVVIFAAIWVISYLKNKKDKDPTQMAADAKQVSDQQMLNSSITQISTMISNISNTSLKDIRDQLNPISTIQSDLNKINGIFLNSKQRGNFGEIQLETILTDILGAENEKVWQRQFKLSNNKIIDIILYIDDDKKIAIDSKFPLENYTNIIKSTKKEEADYFRKLFETDVKNKINEAAEYISLKDKIDSVIVFIPSESVFAEIASNSSLLKYAMSKKINLSSPTNIALATMTIKEYDRKFRMFKGMEKSLVKIEELSEEFKRWRERWEKHTRLVSGLADSSKEITVTSEKISKKFNNIHTSDFKKDVEEIKD